MRARRWTIPLLAAAVAIGTTAAPAAAQFPGENGEISHQTQAGITAPCLRSFYDYPLTPLHRLFGELAWAPDGTEFVVEAPPADDTGDGVIVVQVEDCSWREVGASEQRGLTWSPDGTEIALFRDGALTVISAESGKTLREVAAGHGPRASSPRWHPDGHVIAYAGHDGVRVVAADGSTAPDGELVVPGGRGPDWSPDGTRLAYATTDQGIAHSAPDGSDEVLLPPQARNEGSPVIWSPDGQYLLYTGEYVYRTPGEPDVYPPGAGPGPECVVITTDGEFVRTVATNCTGAAWRPVHGPDPTHDMTLVYVYPRLDPDARPWWGNSGPQRLVSVDFGHAWPTSVDPDLLPPDVCGPGWAVQIDWTTNLARHHVPTVINQMYPSTALGWGTVVQAARHHTLEYLTDVPDCD